MRLALDDILEFSRDANHESPEWPEGYWPKADAPPNPKAWDESLAKFRRDSNEMNKLVSDLQNNLLEPFEHGDGQDLLREALLVASHNSYHLGQSGICQKDTRGRSKNSKGRYTGYAGGRAPEAPVAAGHDLGRAEVAAVLEDGPPRCRRCDHRSFCYSSELTGVPVPGEVSARTFLVPLIAK